MAGKERHNDLILQAGVSIVSVSNGNITIAPHGTGNVVLGTFTFNADQVVGAGQDNYVLTYDHATGLINLEVGGGGTPASLAKAIAQTAHGLAVDDWVYLNGTSYALAKADDPATADVAGVVTAVADANNFTLTPSGWADIFSGLTAGTVYFLSASTAGAMTATEPGVGNVSKPLFVAASTTAGYVLIQRGIVVVAAPEDIYMTQGEAVALLSGMAGM